MLAAGADKHASTVQDIARLRFLHVECAGFIEPAGKHLGESLGHMLHHHDAPEKISRQLRQHILKRLWASSRDSDGDNSGWLQMGDRLRFQAFHWFRKSAGDLNAAAL